MSEIMGKRLKYLREKSGYQQKFVASKIGVKNNTLSGYESGKREPDSETLMKLADFYGVTTDYLHGRTDNPKGNDNENTKTDDLDPEFRALAREYNSLQSGDKEILKKLIKSMSQKGREAKGE